MLLAHKQSREAERSARVACNCVQYVAAPPQWWCTTGVPRSVLLRVLWILKPCSSNEWSGSGVGDWCSLMQTPSHSKGFGTSGFCNCIGAWARSAHMHLGMPPSYQQPRCMHAGCFIVCVQACCSSGAHTTAPWVLLALALWPNSSQLVWLYHATRSSQHHTSRTFVTTPPSQSTLA